MKELVLRFKRSADYLKIQQKSTGYDYYGGKVQGMIDSFEYCAAQIEQFNKLNEDVTLIKDIVLIAISMLLSSALTYLYLKF